MLTLNNTKKLFWFTCLVFTAWLFIFDAEASHASKIYINRSNNQSTKQIAQAANQAYPIFRPVINQLRGKTRVPLLLPTYIPKESYPLFVTLNRATPNQYELTIGADKNCNGGNYCRYGTVSGQRITASTPPVEQEYAFLNDPSYQPSERSTEKMGRVALANGVKGYFIPYSSS